MSIETPEGLLPPSDSPAPPPAIHEERRRCHPTRTARMAGSTWTAFAVLGAVVLWYSGAWAGGELVVDGPGVVLFVRLALDYLTTDGSIPYWLPDMWSGTPVWAIGTSFPLFVLVPLAAVVGPVVAAKAGILALQAAGAFGAYSLARSLWDHRPAALVAGVAYGLSPVVVTLGALLGGETSMGVMAAMPWIAWGFRRGLRGEGTRYLVLTGLLVAFAILFQAEYAYGLAILGGCLLAAEVGRVRRGLHGVAVRRLVARALLVVVVSLGVVAHWLFPFLSLAKSFVLSPREMVQAELYRGLAATVGREMGIFLRRSEGLHGVVASHREDLVSHAFYLGWVAVALTCVTIVLLARRDDEGTLSAVLLASAVSVWLSTGAIALADGGPAVRRQFLSFVLIGAISGLLLGGFVRRLGVGRAGRPGIPVLVGIVGFLIALPYITPFIFLQAVVPLLGSIRFPRFYVVAALGLALGTAWPIVRLGEWARSRRPDRRRAMSVAAALVVAGAFVVDVWPYRTFYRLRVPEADQAYRTMLRELDARTTPGSSRVIAAGLDPTSADRLIAAGYDLSTGWPHPLASRQLWRVTAEAFPAPDAYALDVIGLSGTAHVVREIHTDYGTDREAVSEVRIFPNDRALPLVRAYDRVLVVGDRSITPELAASLAHRNVGVIIGDPGTAPDLTSMAVSPAIDEDACRASSTEGLAPAIAGEIGTACGIHSWVVTLPSGSKRFSTTLSPGASFTALTGGLQGVSVWLDDKPGQTEFVLNELGADGESPGREVARGLASYVDPNGFAVFTFGPLADSAGKSYVFTVGCPSADCFTELEPRMITGVDIDNSGNVIVGGETSRRHVAAFTPVYERLAPAPATTTALQVDRPGPGKWRIRTSGAGPSLVVVAEANFPGWKAHVDGRPAPVVEADGAFLGVVVGPGTHEIALDYSRPAAATVGRLVTGATLLAIALGGLLSRRRRPRHAFEVGAPPVDGGGEQPLEPGEGEPSQAGPHRAGPGAEGDEPVAAVVDDGEAGPPGHRQQ